MLSNLYMYGTKLFRQNSDSNHFVQYAATYICGQTKSSQISTKNKYWQTHDLIYGHWSLQEMPYKYKDLNQFAGFLQKC